MPQARDSEATFYTWRSNYGGMEVSDARTVRDVGMSDLLTVIPVLNTQQKG